MEKRRTPEIIAGRVNADGSIAAGDGFTIVRNSGGNYTLTVAPGMRIISVTGSTTAALAAGAGFATSAFTERSCTIHTFLTGTTAATDTSFAFTAVGVQQ